MTAGVATRFWWLKFDGFPPNQNARIHHFKKNKLNQQWRQYAWALAKEQGIPTLERIRISAVIYRRALGKADEGNDRDRLKPIQDGIVDAGVVPNDTYRYVTMGSMSERKGTPAIDVLIEEIVE